MTSYRIQEADLVIPDTWSDQSINIFKIPAGENTGDASFIISRDATQGDTPFNEYVTGQIETAKSQLPGFKLAHREDFELRDHAASSIRYSWKRDELELMLCQVFIESKPSVVILTLTTTPDEALKHAAVWKDVIRNYRPIPAEAPAKDSAAPE